MRQSYLFYKTQKKITKGGENISTRLLFRADFIEQALSGVYSFLPLGLRVRKKVENLIREEMIRIGGQEVLLPALQSKELWEKSGRWDEMEPPLFKLKDQHGKDLALGPTHEEIICSLAQKRIFSYRDLPLALFQIQTKFRNEVRPTGGLLRAREFLMKDLYSFHTTKEDLISYYKKVCQAYQRIFQRLELNVLRVEASSGSIGGELSHEFMVLAPSGEDRIYLCPSCKEGFNEELLKEKDRQALEKKCQKCGALLERKTAIECAHTFYLGTRYSEKLGVNFIDKKGKQSPVLMGCYGIGIGRLMATVVEVHHDKAGIVWPREIAPFKLHLLNLNPQNQQVRDQAENLYQELRKDYQEVLYDDRKEVGAGEKLVEADLIGCPLRIVISEKTFLKQAVELKERNKEETKLVNLKEAVKILGERVK